MSPPQDPTRATNDAVRRAVAEWTTPARLMGSQILPPTAGLARANPILGAAMVDPTRSSLFVKSVREAASVGPATLPTLLGSSLAAQAARPSLGLDIAEMVGGSAGGVGMVGRIAEIGKQIALINEAARAPVQGIAQMLRNAQKAIAPWHPHIDRFAGVLSDWAEGQSEMDEESDLFVARHGWPVPMSLQIGAYKQVVSKARSGKREVNGLMVHWFRPGTNAYATVREVIHASPDFESRRPLLRQVYAAQRRRHWYMVINGLLPLVEGVLLDALFPTGTRPRTVKPGIERLAGAPESYADTGFRAVETIIVGAGSGSALFDDYAPPQGVEPRSLNRHGVLHGSSRRYGTELNATKLFLLMAVLAECLDMYRTVVEREGRQRRKQLSSGTDS
jgi:hypothetical protein